mgnify:CR=1 FL=1
MKKKIIALALAAVMVVLTLGLASCTGGDNTDPAGEGGTNAAKNGTLTVGFDAEFPPMGFKDDNGNYVGFDLDLAKEVAKRLNILGAADTFRAAAIEQLEVWAQRAEVPLIKHKEGADPAAVVFDTSRRGQGPGL